MLIERLLLPNFYNHYIMETRSLHGFRNYFLDGKKRKKWNNFCVRILRLTLRLQMIVRYLSCLLGRTCLNLENEISLQSFFNNNAVNRINFHFWSGKRGSNPRPSACKAKTLPLSYSRKVEAETGFEPVWLGYEPSEGPLLNPAARQKGFEPLFSPCRMKSCH